MSEVKVNNLKDYVRNDHSLLQDNPPNFDSVVTDNPFDYDALELAYKSYMNTVSK